MRKHCNKIKGGRIGEARVFFFPSLSDLDSITSDVWVSFMIQASVGWDLPLWSQFLSVFSHFVNLCTPLVGMQNGTSAMGTSMEFTQTFENRTTIDPAISVLGIYSKELRSESQRDISTSKPSIIHNSQDVETT